MRISVQKTKILVAEERIYNRRVRIKVRENQEIEQVDEFTYLPRYV